MTRPSINRSMIPLPNAEGRPDSRERMAARSSWPKRSVGRGAPSRRVLILEFGAALLGRNRRIAAAVGGRRP